MLTITLVDGIALRQLPFDHMISRVAKAVRAGSNGYAVLTMKERLSIARQVAGTFQIKKIADALKVEIERQNQVTEARRNQQGDVEPPPFAFIRDPKNMPSKGARLDQLIACRLSPPNPAEEDVVSLRRFVERETGLYFGADFKRRQHRVSKSAITLLVKPSWRLTNGGRTSTTRCYVVHIPRIGKATCWSVPGELHTLADAFFALMPVGAHKAKLAGWGVEPDWATGEAVVAQTRFPFRKTAISVQGAQRLRWKTASVEK